MRAVKVGLVVSAVLAMLVGIAALGAWSQAQRAAEAEEVRDVLRSAQQAL